MSARESIESLWDRATPVAPLLDAYRAEVLREAADRIMDDARHRYDLASGPEARSSVTAVAIAADLIDPHMKPKHTANALWEKRMRQQHDDDVAKLQAVDLLHRPYAGFCDECSQSVDLVPYPCPTILAIRGPAK